MSNLLMSGVNPQNPFYLHWYKSTLNEWLQFEFFNLNSVTSSGVYIIWHGGLAPRVVYVGQGDVKSRLEAHRHRFDICAYRSSGTLYVTWADVSAAQRDGVERYLADLLNPLIGDAHPMAAPIAVNKPW